MFEWFVIAVFVSLYAVFCIGMFIAILSIMSCAANLAWTLMRKVFPSLPENRDEYFEEIEQGRRIIAKLGWVSNKDKH